MGVDIASKPWHGISMSAEEAHAEFPSRLAMLRHWRRLEQKELAELTGLHPSHISRFENGKQEPSLRNLIKLVVALGSPAYLFGLVDLPDPVDSLTGGTA